MWSRRAGRKQKNQFPSNRFKGWLDKRIPPASKISLSHRNIFILPTRYGFGFVVTFVLVLIAGINYQNALVHGLAFFMISVFLIAMLQTYRNLEGLCVHQFKTVRGVVGDFVRVPIELTGIPGRDHLAVKIFWPDWVTDQRSSVQSTTEEVQPTLLIPHRGYVLPGRLRLESNFPLGLFCAWSWLDLDITIIGVPRPIKGDRPQNHMIDQQSLRADQNWGLETLGDIRPYRSEDDRRYIHWRISARRQQLMAQARVAPQPLGQWLSLDDFSGIATEERLGRLAYLVLTDFGLNQSFGLELGGDHLAIGVGAAHQAAALDMLALYR